MFQSVSVTYKGMNYTVKLSELTELQKYLEMGDRFNQAPTATPVIATPVIATPVIATPVIATPVIATPVIATPVLEAEAEAEDYDVYHSEDLYDLFEEHFPDDSKETLKSNTSCIYSILKLIGKDEINIEFFLDYDNIIKLLRLDDSITDATKANRLLSIRKLFRIYNIDPPDAYYKEIGLIKDNVTKNHSFNASAKEAPLLKYLDDKEEAIRHRLFANFNIETTSLYTKMKYILFLLYMDFPPFRSEWANVVGCYEDINDGKTNYYNIHTSKICLQSFKNKSDGRPSMTAYINKYPDVFNSLSIYIDHHHLKDEPQFLLFLSKTKKPMKGGNYSTILNDVFSQVGLSVNVLRKRYVNKYVFGNTKTPMEIAEIHRIMNHTADTALMWYAKS